MRSLLFLFSLFCAPAFSQTLGGSAAYGFLRLPASPLLQAAGGANVSYGGDVSLAANNPALLRPMQHGQLNAAFNVLPGAIRGLAMTGALAPSSSAAVFGGSILLLDYGTLPQTDAAGNVSGSFRPVDFAVQVSAAKAYLEKWRYGATVKFIHSAYAQYRSSAVAADVGLWYADSTAGFSAGLLAKNMGAQLSTFAGAAEDLPFDLQVGLTKRLSRAPFGFSLTLHHLHRLNLLYNDPAFNADNGFSAPGAFDKVFTHVVLATHVYLGQQLEALIGYNHLRRQELSIPGGSNGLTGFSLGIHARFNRLQVQFARAAYQRGVAANQLGITVPLVRKSAVQ